MVDQWFSTEQIQTTVYTNNNNNNNNNNNKIDRLAMDSYRHKF